MHSSLGCWLKYRRLPFGTTKWFLYRFSGKSVLSILTWYREHRDQKGGLPRSRPFHCTPVRLKPAIAPNVSNSGMQFFSVGDCVRAIPCQKNENEKPNPNLMQHSTRETALLRYTLCFIIFRVSFCSDIWYLPGQDHIII